MKGTILFLLILFYSHPISVFEDIDWLNRYEKKTANHYHIVFERNGLNWNSITGKFESFFKDIELVVEDSSDTSFYFQILDHLQHYTLYSDQGKLIVKQVDELLAEFNKEGLTKAIASDCIYTLLENYKANKQVDRVPWGFHVLGTSIGKFQEMNEEVHPALIIGALKTMKNTDYQNKFYNHSLILLVYYIFSNTSE